MVFSSATFLFFFLPFVVFVYALTPRVAKNFVLLAFSIMFYVWGSGALVAVLVTSVVVDYGLGFVAQSGVDTDSTAKKRFAIAASVVANLGLLAWFKYAGWLIDAAAEAGWYTGSIPQVVLPIGISFFTFQSMSYTIDVARGRCRHLANPIDFGLYVTLFPQLIAGPIVRYHEIDAQIRSRDFSIDLIGQGAVRFSHGLAKKVIVADTVAPVADAAFNGTDLSTPVAWLGLIAYTVQIYFDFSGYSDMAIGLGQMFGFAFPENFARPYSAVSITDFWRRWHMTLSNWFRDYLYIPLGGSRGRAIMVYRNLLIVFLLVGLWHGANWTFVLWGAYHGIWLLLERATHARGLEPMSAAATAVRRVFTLSIVMLGWVLFRAGSLATAADYYKAMFSFDTANIDLLRPVLTTRVAITLALASTVALMPRALVLGPSLLSKRSPAFATARAFTMAVALPAALLLVAAGSVSPFLYFQF